MLINFSFLCSPSFPALQILGMEANRSKELQESHTGFSGAPNVPRLVRTALIYGAATAGQSQLIRAMQEMRDCILNSTKIPAGQSEVIFVEQGIQYQYGFIADSERIIEEWLFAYPNGRRQEWFNRVYVSEEGQYEWIFGRGFEGTPAQQALWQSMTSHDALFLSIALFLNNTQLRPIKYWFDKNKIVTADPAYTLKRMHTPEGKESVQKFMAAVGIIHQNSEEAQRLFALAGFWLDAIEQGGILWVDYFDRQLHPLVSRALLRMICHVQNKRNAQLIGIAQDISLLDKTVLRFDQIWFMDNKEQQEKRLYPLLDFTPQRGDNIGKKYFDGEYGAIPNISQENKK